MTATAIPSGQKLRQRALTLGWLTIAWNVVEATVAIGAGQAAGSSALIGFGLDATIEFASASVIVWQFSAPDARREHVALRLIALSFFALAAFLAIQAGLDLFDGQAADASRIGIALALASLVVMPQLAMAKQKVGALLGSASVTADSRQTWLCTYLSAVLLVGLVLNATLGWWWADPVVALVIAALATREGIEAWRGETCCD